MKEHWLDPVVICSTEQQYIKINNDIKHLLEKDCGVPQGLYFDHYYF